MISLHKLNDYIVVSFDDSINLFDIKEIKFKNNTLTIFFTQVCFNKKTDSLFSSINYEVINNDIKIALEKIFIKKRYLILTNEKQLKNKDKANALDYFV
jgi:hypothetical protein